MGSIETPADFTSRSERPFTAQRSRRAKTGQAQLNHLRGARQRTALHHAKEKRRQWRTHFAKLSEWKFKVRKPGRRFYLPLTLLAKGRCGISRPDIGSRGHPLRPPRRRLNQVGFD